VAPKAQPPTPTAPDPPDPNGPSPPEPKAHSSQRALT